LEQSQGTVITIASGPENLQVDLKGCDFNGAGRPETSNQAYLTCEFHNG
jgi:hypothetical protein